jgi:hypothetical protein
MRAPDCEREGYQALLGAVMQVPFDLPAGLVRCG